MRDKPRDVAEKGRVRDGLSPHGETFGHFVLAHPGTRATLRVLVGDAVEWPFPPPAFEHASVSVVGQDRCPTWEELCWVKGLFWGPEECVIQYHPPESEYVNVHRFVLHLWKPVGVEIPRPPRECV